MRALACLLLAGCATSWGITQAAGGQKILDEGVRESVVPLPGPREELRVVMPTQQELYPPPAQPNGQAGVGVGSAKPFALACTVMQHGQDTVYHSAFRYGHTWKWLAAVSFVIEAGTAALIYAAKPDDVSNQVGAGLVAADALVTGALAFAPRKEVFRVEQRADDTFVRGDCPEGLALAVGAQSFPVDALGRVGELGATALDDWMRTPAGPLRVTLGSQDETLPIGGDEQCSWNASHHQTACVRRSAGLDPAVTLVVPLGTLTRAE